MTQEDLAEVLEVSSKCNQIEHRSIRNKAGESN